MTEIKNCIGLLCNQLNLLFNTSLESEHFRLAKFNKTDKNVVNVMWDLLNFLTIKEVNTRVSIIKEYLQEECCYACPLFFALPEDMSSGSREILLAICFILSKNLNVLIMNEVRNTPFDETYNLIKDGNNPPIINIPDLKSEDDVSNFCLWVEGKIRMYKKLSIEYQTQTDKFFSKLNSSSNVKLNNLSLNETLASNNKEYCKHFLDKTEKVMELLKCYQLWKRKEHVFWKWMLTVLSEREKDISI